MGKKALFCLVHYLAVVFTGVLFAAALFSRHASFVVPNHGELWVALAMLMPVILLANLAAFVWWLIRRRWFVALMPIAALVLNLGYISAMFRLPDFQTPDTRYDLRMATLNTHGFRHRGKTEATASAMAWMANKEALDVLCMQEFLETGKLPADSIGRLFAPRMPYFVREGGQAVISRFPIVAHRYLRFPDTNDCLVADLVVGGDTVRVISVHLQTSGISSLRHRFRKDYDREMPVDLMFGTIGENSRIRARQVADIRSIVDTSRMPVILAGDFNDTPSSYTYRRMKQGFTDGFCAVGKGYGGTFRYMGGILRIDYIFYDDEFTGVRYYTPRYDVSDHKIVVADLQLNK